MDEEFCRKDGQEDEIESEGEIDDEEEGPGSVEKDGESEADKGLCGIDAVMFGNQVEGDGKRFVDPSSYFEKDERSLSLPLYGTLAVEFPMITIDMRKG